MMNKNEKPSLVHPYNYATSKCQVIPQTLLDNGEKLTAGIHVPRFNPPHVAKIPDSQKDKHIRLRDTWLMDTPTCQVEKVLQFIKFNK
jgi:hypothetical protein